MGNDSVFVGTKIEKWNISLYVIAEEYNQEAALRDVL